MSTFAQKQAPAAELTSSSLTRPNSSDSKAHLRERTAVKTKQPLQHHQAPPTLPNFDTARPSKLEHKPERAESLGSYQNFALIPLHGRAAPALQTKLAINNPGDEFEQEADRVADQVTRMTPHALPPSAAPVVTLGSATPRLQRQCACGGTCSDCQKRKPNPEPEKLQRKITSPIPLGSAIAPPIVHRVVRSPGHPLDAATRAFMEPRFGRDFSRVRVHADTTAQQSAQSINARAYTVGQDMFFNVGQFAPATTEGRHLLAHELTHVTQNGVSSPEIVRRSPFGSIAKQAQSSPRENPVCDAEGQIVSTPNAQAIQRSKPCPSIDKRQAMFKAALDQVASSPDADYETKMQAWAMWELYLTPKEFEQYQMDHESARRAYARYKTYYDRSRPGKPRDFSDLPVVSVTYGEDPRDVQARIGENIESNVGGAIAYGIAHQFTNDPQRLEGASGFGAGVGDLALTHGGAMETRASHPDPGSPRPEISTRFEEKPAHPTEGPSGVSSPPGNTGAAPPPNQSPVRLIHSDPDVKTTGSTAVLHSVDLDGNLGDPRQAATMNPRGPDASLAANRTGASNDHREIRATGTDGSKPLPPPPPKRRIYISPPVPASKPRPAQASPAAPVPDPPKPLPKGVYPEGQSANPRRTARYLKRDPATVQVTEPTSQHDDDILGANGMRIQTKAYPGQHQHHVFPQELRDWFAERFQGIEDIHEYTIYISQGEHEAMHKRGKGGTVNNVKEPDLTGWNQEWKDFRGANETATPQAIFEEAGRLMDKYRISDAVIDHYHGTKKK